MFLFLSFCLGGGGEWSVCLFVCLGEWGGLFTFCFVCLFGGMGWFVCLFVTVFCFTVLDKFHTCMYLYILVHCNSTH